MNIAVMSHTKKQDLMVQFCTAYCGVLSKHSVCATNATGRMVADATGLPVHLFLSHEHGGIERERGPEHVHDVVGAGDAPAATLHVYAPRLTLMNHYEVDDDGRLRLTSTEAEGVDW